MLRSRGINQICHTYSEDMHPIYPPLPWLHTPRLRLGVTTVAEDIWVHILLLGVVYPIPIVLMLMHTHHCTSLIISLGTKYILYLHVGIAVCYIFFY